MIITYVIRANGMRFGPFGTVGEACKWAEGYVKHCEHFDVSLARSTPWEFAVEEVRGANPVYLEDPATLREEAKP